VGELALRKLTEHVAETGTTGMTKSSYVPLSVTEQTKDFTSQLKGSYLYAVGVANGQTLTVTAIGNGYTDPYAALFRVSGSRPGGDLNLQVLDINDDYYGLNPRVRWTNTSGSTLTVYVTVFAWSPYSSGTADVLYSGGLSHMNVPVSGERFYYNNVGDDTPEAGSQTYPVHSYYPWFQRFTLDNNTGQPAIMIPFANDRNVGWWCSDGFLDEVEAYGGWGYKQDGYYGNFILVFSPVYGNHGSVRLQQFNIAQCTGNCG
jgi:hypothetical protein